MLEVIRELKHVVSLMAEELNREIEKCERCRLCELEVNKKYGKLYATGNRDSKIIFVGIAPSCYRTEMSDHKAFVGKTSGDFFRNILDEMGFKGEEMCITNLMKCSTLENKLPTAGEINFCNHWFEKEIELVKPEIVVALGGFVGRILDEKYFKSYKFKLFKIYHPAAVKRNLGFLDKFKKQLAIVFSYHNKKVKLFKLTDFIKKFEVNL